MKKNITKFQLKRAKKVKKHQARIPGKITNEKNLNRAVINKFKLKKK